MENQAPTSQEELPFSPEHGVHLPKILSQDTNPVSTETTVALAYGDADLGTRFIISGGEVLEI